MGYRPYMDHEHERWLREREDLKAAEEAYDEALDRRERFEPQGEGITRDYVRRLLRSEAELRDCPGCGGQLTGPKCLRCEDG